MDPARIDADQLRRAAQAARLALDEGEIDRFATEFRDILAEFRRLEAVPPLPTPSPETGAVPLRLDEPRPDDPEPLLARAPQRAGRFFAVPSRTGSDAGKGAAGPPPPEAGHRRPWNGTVGTFRGPGPFAERPAAELAASVRRGDLRARDLVEEALGAVTSHAGLRALVPPVAGAARRARRRAEEIDREVAAGRDPGPLAGVPVAVKDNLCTRDLPTTCASRILEGFVAPFSATVVERLEAAGAIVVAKANMDEFAMGSTGETSARGAPRNPHDPDRVAGGSSGGSAAAVAAGLVPIALGSETGGSIRQPAALTGVLGLRTPWGRIPRWGLVALASSLDQPGPLARSVGDLALLFRVLAGPDPRDPTSIPDRPPSVETGPWRPIEDLRVGLLEGPLEDPGLEPAVREAVRAAADALAERGARVEPVRLPLAPLAIAAYHLLVAAEAASNLARYDGVRYGPRVAGRSFEELVARTRGAGFGAEVKRRVLLGTWALRAGWEHRWLDRARAVRAGLAREARALLGRVDLLLGPTTPTRAFPLGSRVDPLAVWLCDAFVVPANLADLPALSLPAPSRPGDLPAGVQLVAPSRREDVLLRAAGHLEDAGFRAPLPPRRPAS